ncbi:MAG: hypothetical protein JXP34_17925 [Planctomycetes bacterium]|nr:hypothetical protein [Planctomycetota bacterium]
MAWKQIPHPPDREPAPLGSERIYLEGAGLRAGFDTGSGRLVELASRATGASFLAQACVGGTWRLYDTRGLWIEGACERPAEVISGGRDHIEFIYARPRQWGLTFPIEVRVLYRIDGADGGLRTAAHVRHLGGPVTIERVQHPVISGLSEFAGPSTQLLLPFIGGERRPAPLSGDWSDFEYIYPNEAMAWLALFDGRESLYLASHDPDFRWMTIRGRAARRRRPPELEICFERCGFIRDGEGVRTPDAAIDCIGGTWHAAADRYRKWIEGWYQPPEIPARAQDLRGLIEMMFAYRDADGRMIERDPEELYAYARRCRRELGLDVAHLCGYHEGGFDADYPLYDRVLPSIGGEAGLERFIDRCNRTPGMTTDIYINCRLTDIDTEWWGGTGLEWACRSKDGTPFVEYYNHRRFTIACPMVGERRDWWLEQIERFVRWGIGGIQIDQPHTTARECWAWREHGHPDPFSHWAQGFLLLFRMIRERVRAIDPQVWLWGESASDVFSPFFDYSCIYARYPEARVSFGETDPATRDWVFDPRGFGQPEAFRYVCPEIRMLQCPRRILEDEGDAIESLNLIWAYGAMVYWPGNLIGYDLDRVPEGFRRHLKRIYDVRAAHPHALARGRFRDTIGLETDADKVYARLYVTDRRPEGIAVAAINRDRGNAVGAEVVIDPARLGLPTGAGWRWAELGAGGGEEGTGTAAKVRIPANGVALVEFTPPEGS